MAEEKVQLLKAAEEGLGCSLRGCLEASSFSLVRDRAVALLGENPPRLTVKNVEYEWMRVAPNQVRVCFDMVGQRMEYCLQT